MIDASDVSADGRWRSMGHGGRHHTHLGPDLAEGLRPGGGGTCDRGPRIRRSRLVPEYVAGTLARRDARGCLGRQRAGSRGGTRASAAGRPGPQRILPAALRRRAEHGQLAHPVAPPRRRVEPAFARRSGSSALRRHAKAEAPLLVRAPARSIPRVPSHPPSCVRCRPFVVATMACDRPVGPGSDLGS